MSVPVPVLVTGAGGVYGQATIANLRRSTLDVRIVGADTQWSAPGALLSDVPAVLPRVDDPSYAEALGALARAHGVRVVFVCSGTEIRELCERRSELERATGAFVIMPSTELWATASDKYATVTFLEREGFAFPRTSLSSEGATFPLVAKPRFGHGSRGLVICHTAADLARATGEEYVFQEYLGDDDHEFTVGVLATEEGEVLTSIVLRRWLSGGQTGACEVVDAPRIAAYAEAVAARLRPRGYLNVQLRLREGEPVAFEVNPRVSSSTGFRALAGVNEPELLLRRYLLGESPPRPVPRLVAMVRTLTEQVVSAESWELTRPRRGG